MRKFLLYCLIIPGLFISAAAHSQGKAKNPSLNNQKMDGYKGIWFTIGQTSKYGDKYSGGFATYTSEHSPLAIYAPKVNKTFFVYGGTTAADEKYLLCMAGCYDHTTNTVSKPVVVYDKKGVIDPHDNPALAIDDDGYIWVFVSGRAKARPGFKYRSRKPYSIEAFDQITQEEMTYPQPKYVSGKGFLNLFTKYTGVRELYFETSKDGVTWSEDQMIAGMKNPGYLHSGHYQVSGQYGEKIVLFCNWHPNGNVDKRTNLYYLQTVDMGKTWTTADGKPVTLPLRDVTNPAEIREYFSKGKNLYVHDVGFDKNGNPMCLYLTGIGSDPGPDNGLKDWMITYWDGSKWIDRKVGTSDHNYDMGSIIVKGDLWTVVAPFENSPQKWGGGGEVVMMSSTDKGATWKSKQITHNSVRNNNYVRKSINGKDPFQFFWGDGDPYKFSKSQMYFGDSHGHIWQLPYDMTSDNQTPVKIQ